MILPFPKCFQFIRICSNEIHIFSGFVVRLHSAVKIIISNIFHKEFTEWVAWTQRSYREGGRVVFRLPAEGPILGHLQYGGAGTDYIKSLGKKSTGVDGGENSKLIQQNKYMYHSARGTISHLLFIFYL